MSVAEVIRRHRLLVCIGTGGVGKTSLSAAIALVGALAGRKAAVLTIDPARALGRALGIGDLGSDLSPVDDEFLRSAGLAPTGTLSAGMLEQSRAWDAFVERHAPTPGAARSILDNGFYRQLSRGFSGSTEYVAVEELCRLHESGRYDLIVLDTPPAAHGLDFVRAPSRIDKLLDPEVIGALLRPPPVASRIWRLLENATGTQTLSEVSSLVSSFERLFEAVRRRSHQSQTLLRSATTAFVLVSGPESEALFGAKSLHASLKTFGIPLRAVVQNRTHPLRATSEGDVNALLDGLAADGIDAASIHWLRSVHADALLTARAEARSWEAFRADLPAEVVCTRVPELDHDVHSISDLAKLAGPLVAG